MTATGRGAQEDADFAADLGTSIMSNTPLSSSYPNGSNNSFANTPSLPVSHCKSEHATTRELITMLLNAKELLP